MDLLDKKSILENINFLVSSTKYDEVMEACLQYPPSDGKIFFSNSMKQEIENRHQTKEDRHAALFQKITQRGPKAYNILLEILASKSFNSALNKLSEANQSIRNNRNNNSSATNNTPRVITPRRPSTSSSQKPRTEQNGNLLNLIPENLSEEELSEPIFTETNNHTAESKIDVYPMTKRNRGVFLLVNISKFIGDFEKERRGANFDTDNLMRLFGNLGFQIFKYEDVTKAQFQDLLTKLIDSDFCRQSQCFVMALMSHGQMIDRKTAYVTFFDGQKEEVHNILDNFSNKTCSTLIKKPKILFFPFCRGDSIDIGVPDVRQDDETEQDAHLMGTPNLPTFSDMMICYGSLPGFVANREPSEGSWYINALYDVFVGNAHDTHFEDMLKMIGPKIEELYGHKKGVSRQTPVYWNYSFTKHLYFNPGQYSD